MIASSRAISRIVVALMLWAGLTACATHGGRPQPGDDAIIVKGALAYRERIALPPDSRARVTVRDISVADREAPVIAGKTIELGHRQVPIDFELTLAKDRLQPRRRYGLRATIRGPRGHLLWATDTAHVVEPGKSMNNMGTLRLIQAGASRDISLPFKASGNEPGWALTISDERVDLEWAYGEKQSSTPRPAPIRIRNGTRYVADTETHALRVDILDSICRDAMTGMPHPDRVRVTIDGERLEGCGGDPGALLTGTEWRVEDIAGRGIIDASRVTLSFDANGQLHGHASCNGYRGPYELTGEGLSVGTIASTLKACASALNNQEDRFLRLLRDARSFDIDTTGKLIIRAQSGQILEAYPAG